MNLIGNRSLIGLIWVSGMLGAIAYLIPDQVVVVGGFLVTLYLALLGRKKSEPNGGNNES